MKIIRLSNHTRDGLQSSEAARQKRYEDALRKHEEVCQRNERDFAERRQQHERRMRELGEGFHSACTKKKILQATWLGLRVVCEGVFGKPHKPQDPPRPTKEEIDEEDKAFKAGLDGENAVERKLAESLDDSWIGFRGFHGARGEIDFVLAGPGGLAAIEVKCLNGHLTCDGDSWTRDKYDAYGNCVETDLPVRDKGGRSPSRQLREAAGWLHREIRKNLPHCPLRTLIVLSHERSKIEAAKNLGISELVLLRHWNVGRSLARMEGDLAAGEVKELARAIRALHDCRQGRRKNKRRRHRSLLQEACRP